jgi:hypothetical protein
MVCFQVAGSLPDAVFYDSLNAFKRIGNLPYPGENDTLPNPRAFIIGNIPDLFLASEVTVYQALFDGFVNAQRRDIPHLKFGVNRWEKTFQVHLEVMVGLKTGLID